MTNTLAVVRATSDLQNEGYARKMLFQRFSSSMIGTVFLRRKGFGRIRAWGLFGFCCVKLRVKGNAGIVLAPNEWKCSVLLGVQFVGIESGGEGRAPGPIPVFVTRHSFQ